jgi:S-phase kinase-associated protein 1
MSETRTVRLISQECDQFEVSLDVAKMSELVRTMFNGFPSSSLWSFHDDQIDDEVPEIPLPDVKTHILAKVIEYAEHYQVEPMTEIAKVRICLNFNFRP